MEKKLNAFKKFFILKSDGFSFSFLRLSIIHLLKPQFLCGKYKCKNIFLACANEKKWEN